MKTASTTRTTFICWLKFNLVGGMGILLQLTLIAIFSEVCHMAYLGATVLAVELTVLHNFVWHERYRWKEKLCWPSKPDSLVSRLIRFHIGNGAVSLVGNVLLMKIFAGELHIPVLVANALAITICSLVNFCLADRWVFARGTNSRT